MLQTTWQEVILHGLQGMTSERQVISYVNGFNGPKWQEMHNNQLLYNTTIIVDLLFSGLEVLLNSKRYHIELGSALVNMKLTVL